MDYLGRVVKHQSTDEWHVEALRLIESIPRGVKGKRVLDFGCGPGQMSYLIWLFGARQVDGVDNVTMLTWAKRHYPRGPEFLTQPSGKYDVIVCSHVLGHLDWPYLRLHDLTQHLAPGGIIAVLNPNAWNTRARMLPNLLKGYKGDPTLAFHFSKRGLDELMRHVGLTCMHWYRCGRRWSWLPSCVSRPLFAAFYE